MKLKKLPIGQSSFENLIKEKYIYVDKTKILHNLITTGQFYFLSRPRRFGKSLLVSTLENIFLGNKELFKDLWICTSDYEWKKHPVIVIDFNEVLVDTPENLKSGLCRVFDKIAKEHDICLESKEEKYKFEELVILLEQKYNEKVVVLIDEYDKPIISHLGEGSERLEIAKKNREILKSLFGTIKGKNVIRNLRFVLLTGVSKFSRAGVFSELNNLNDITMDAEYSDLLGITEEEVERYFKEHILEISKKLKCSYKESIEKIKEYYNGYRFSEEEIYVYNPFSFLNVLSKKKFKNYWFESGTPTFLVNLLKEKDFYLPRAEELIVEESIFSTYELENLNPSALLFQTGYLTIKDCDIETNEYVLSYPNKEVKYSFLKILYRSYVNGGDRENRFLELGRALRKGDVDRFIEVAMSIFSGISYSVGSKINEANFHTLFYLMVNAGGSPADMELLTSEGRIDMVVKLKDKIYIMEFKCNQSADKAIEQIKKKDYISKFKFQGVKLYVLGINFDTDSRNISEYKYEISI